ncbi:MAG: Ig-like domain-containing protein [Balneolaceae bacterium]|nr:Ig-like domain-containing protein [Balneolaceae bacterium]MBO6546897.1 Ig-like domain-containing protein [Balneolaceae bacterium]MBO6649257.1 Ig-like domain-containing protein [Balneolaceae bacterium]
MKKINTIFKYTLVLTLAVFVAQGCDNDNGPVDLNIESITVGGADLNGATSPSDVAADASITITFNSDIKPETATSSNITLVQDYDQANIELTIEVDGPMLTVTPATTLGSGTLYSFSISMGLLNMDDQPLTSTTRTFTTAGTFSPSGMIANWTFEDTAEDIVGDYDPSASAVVDITYTDSRNAAAGKAATFNGNTSIIEIPGADALVNTSDFTISFWMKTNSDGHVNANGDPAGHFVMGLGAFFGLQFEVFGGYNGAKFAIQYEFGDGTTGAEDMWFPVEATDNTNGGWQGWDFAKSITQEQMEGYLKDNWTQITYTYEGADKKGRLYYNSELMKSFDFDLWPDDAPKKTTVGMIYAGSEPDVVNELALGFVHSRAGTMWDDTPWGGYDNTTANHFKGQLDDIKIYHKVLTDTEIQLMYDSEN